MRPLVAEFIGPAGSGKTTLCRATADVLRNADFEVVTKDSVPRAGQLSSLRRTQIGFAAWWLSRTMGARYGGRYDHEYWCNRLADAWRLYRPDYPSGPTLVLSDEGILQPLRKAEHAPPRLVLPLLPLPHVVLHVRAPTNATRLWRLMERDTKPSEVTKPATGASRQRRAIFWASAFLRESTEGNALRFLQEWNRRHCSPPLSDDEIHDLIRQAAAQPVNLPPSIIEDLKSSLESRGCLWLDIENPNCQLPSGAVAEILISLMPGRKRPHNRPIVNAMMDSDYTSRVK